MLDNRTNNCSPRGGFISLLRHLPLNGINQYNVLFCVVVKCAYIFPGSLFFLSFCRCKSRLLGCCFFCILTSLPNPSFPFSLFTRPLTSLFLFFIFFSQVESRSKIVNLFSCQSAKETPRHPDNFHTAGEDLLKKENDKMRKCLASMNTFAIHCKKKKSSC